MTHFLVHVKFVTATTKTDFTVKTSNCCEKNFVNTADQL